MPNKDTTPLSPIEEETTPSSSTLIEPLAWKCCMCNLSNFFFDDNYAWFYGISEHCIKLDCLHQRCSTCHDPGPAHWPLKYADGRPTQHLFLELQASLAGNEEDDTPIVSDVESNPDSPSNPESVVDFSSDEERGRSTVLVARRHLSEIFGDTAVTHPCPLRETIFCPERFESADAAWQHSRVHVGQEIVPCALATCLMTFSGKDAMRLHYIAMHS